MNKTIAFLIFLAKRCGNVATLFSRMQSALGRVQTRLLTSAQSRGWRISGEEEARLARKQFQLFLWRQSKAAEKKVRHGVAPI